MVTISIKTQVYVDEKRRIMIDLPNDVEPGMVELDMVVRQTSETSPAEPLSRREQVKAMFREAGMLAENVLSEAERAQIKELSQEERERIGRQLAGGKTALELINEEREERF